MEISIHALLAESDLIVMLYDTSSLLFLSTLSLRRATVAPVLAVGRAGYFYPRSPCGERLQRQIEFERYSDISIHALLAESDGALGLQAHQGKISIHALLAESDGPFGADKPRNIYFYPRSPCGERLTEMRVALDDIKFLSTLSLRRATQVTFWQDIDERISIHALLAESDTSKLHKNICGLGFLSTLSLRRATACWYIKEMTANISIHALLAESDRKSFRARQYPANFYPRSPCGERLASLT